MFFNSFNRNYRESLIQTVTKSQPVKPHSANDIYFFKIDQWSAILCKRCSLPDIGATETSFVYKATMIDLFVARFC